MADMGQSAAAPRAGGPPIASSVSSGSTPPPQPSIFDPIFSLFRPFLARLRVAHDEAVVGSAALPPGLPDDVRRGWGIRALMMRGKRERGERRAARGLGAGGGGEVDAEERRAGFMGDGGEQLEDEGDGDAWEDDGSDGSEDESDRPAPRRNQSAAPPRANPSAPQNGACSPFHRPNLCLQTIRCSGHSVPATQGVGHDWRGRGMDGEQSWTWQGAIRRWRLKDVQHY